MNILSKIPIFFQTEGGSGNVQNLPEVPSPSDADLEALSGEEEEEHEEISEGKEPKGKKEESEEEEEEPDEEIDKGRRQPPPRAGEKPDIEEEDEEETEEKVDEKVAKGEPEKIPSLRAIKEKYPNIFKEFPNVRTAIAEHQQFRQVFGSVEEAKDAVETEGNFHKLRDALWSGDFGMLYDEIHSADPAVVAKLAKNILPTILEKNSQLYLDITDAPIRQFLKAAYNAAQGAGNKNLANSTMYLNQYLTGTFGEPKIGTNAPDPKEEEFNKKIQAHETKLLQQARSDVSGSIIEEMSDILTNAIDPKKALPEETRTALVERLSRKIDGIIASDENHMTRVERLWANAQRSSYARAHLSRIINAYLERAKQVLPPLARKVREENNIRLDMKTEEKKIPAEKSGRIPPRPTGGPPSRSPTIRDTNPRDIDWNRTSDKDILDGKAFRKKS